VSALLGIDSAYNAVLVPFITLGVGILVMIVAGVYFDVGLRKYESAGN
jgi:ABC-2 type transport system permease protein